MYLPQCFAHKWSFIFLFILFVVVGGLLGVQNAHAKTPEVNVRDPEGYATRYITQSIGDPIKIEAGDTKEVSITFKNIGSKTWKNTGPNYISAYTMEPKYRSSPFSGSGWLSTKQTAKMQNNIAPGQTGDIIIRLHAPQKTGAYTEKFYLASENYSWIKNGYFYLKIQVVEPTKTEPAPRRTGQAHAKAKKEPVAQQNSQIKNSQKETKADTIYKVKRLGQTSANVTATGGEKIKVIAIFQNLGNTPLKEYTLVANRPVVAAGVGQEGTFADSSWQSHTVIANKTNTVDVQKTFREEFFVRAPKQQGKYTLNLSLKTNNDTVVDTDVTVNLDVTKNAPLNYAEPVFENDKEVVLNDDVSNTLWLNQEPRIKVGMHLPMPFVQFKSPEHAYVVYANDMKIGELPPGRLAVVSFDGVYYKVKAKNLDYVDVHPPRIEPKDDPRAVFVLLNYDRHVRWKGPDNFNEYRGAFEYRQGKVDKKMYAVNDLLMSDYVAGIGETSNKAPKEYIRALLTAARTYAYKSKEKYPFFDVLGNTYDQLYLGYVSEKLMPHVAQAARDTRGYLVFYDNEVAITPYFANSTGKTKSWKSVWGGTHKPWLVPVSAGYDVGQPMRGHGVGMSARDAAVRADKEGVDWKYLLKYYYTGVDVLRVFE